MKNETFKKALVIFGLIYLFIFGFYLTAKMNDGTFGWQLEEEEHEGL